MSHLSGRSRARTMIITITSAMITSLFTNTITTIVIVIIIIIEIIHLSPPQLKLYIYNYY